MDGIAAGGAEEVVALAVFFAPRFAPPTLPALPFVVFVAELVELCNGEVVEGRGKES